MPEFPEDSGSDWNACDEDFESDAEEDSAAEVGLGSMY